VVAELRAVPSSVEQNAPAVAALAFLRAGQDTAARFSAKPNEQKAAALLIGLAMVRHKLHSAEMDVALENQQRDILQRQLAALLLRASHLARSLRTMQLNEINPGTGFGDLRQIDDSQSRSAASEALTSYITAWNTGEIPYHVLRFRAVQARRLAAIDRAQLAEQDFRAVIKPAIDTLAEYGAGGVTTESIVTLLGHLGIAGSILAK